MFTIKPPKTVCNQFAHHFDFPTINERSLTTSTGKESQIFTCVSKTTHKCGRQSLSFLGKTLSLTIMESVNKVTHTSPQNHTKSHTHSHSQNRSSRPCIVLTHPVQNINNNNRSKNVMYVINPCHSPQHHNSFVDDLETGCAQLTEGKRERESTHTQIRQA